MRTAAYVFAMGTALGLAVMAAPTSHTNSSCLPVVDLGYELHRALWYNNDTDIYKFQNIRYAREPSGDLRFRAPEAPLTNRSNIQVGAETRICPQGQPSWISKSFGTIAKYSNPTVPFTLDAWVEDIRNGVAPPGDINANATEDCLLLDVHVPKKVLDAAQTKKEGAPVLVFIHGGGDVFGSKDGSGVTPFEPSGILKQSRDNFGEEFVFVSLNYRLGAFGFLAGSEVLRDGRANAGLLDQRFALKWIQENIHLFGGSKNHVTVMAESGGAGAVLHHIASARDDTCGQGSKLFHQAIAQSPAQTPTTRDPEQVYKEFLSFLEVENLDEARKLDSAAIIAGNSGQIKASPPTDYIYGPVVDEKFVTGPLLKNLEEGNFDRSIKVLAAHNVFEGAFFFDPTLETEEDFKDWVKRSLAGLKDEEYDYLSETVYPAVYDGSAGYVDLNTRQMSLWGEAVVDCTYRAISQATKDESYAYEFGLSPGFHIQDLGYTFGSKTSPAPFPEAQSSLQLAIASFPPQRGARFEKWKAISLFGDESLIVNITSAGTLSSVPSAVNQTRCDWWASVAR